ncbi:SRPBCC domain-containing protein [Microbulbifer spongiae]|uniref:SRPBCC domain-containing protein n=1 Tax=Microbulbifer spongiae TaxID=2944933 RepID=A0ABY9E9I5_9GAMM|nr:SRPBCC domain-containing protein [Microbulbifer sp. MI-G]WKD49678.1 SRPBCC domain-containing protein [Microbulbifer sp. MI-G]
MANYSFAFVIETKEQYMTHSEQITIETVVGVPPAVAWKAFNSPDAITQWNQASPDWHCPSADVDLRRGGRLVTRMEARDGCFGFDYSGTFEEVDAPNAVTLRLGDDRRTRTTFEADGDGTRVGTGFDAEAPNPSDIQRDSWQAILDSYAAYVERTG